MTTAVIVFPASNCDRDAAMALKAATGKAPRMIWHKDTSIPDDVRFVVVPGGFSYGDYLRSGAIAANSPIMRDLKRKADGGLAVAGICNGFQILTEAGMLPGALMRNMNQKFVCRVSRLRLANAETRFTRLYDAKNEIDIPVAHHDGNYFADDETLKRIEDNGQVVFRYSDNPNGSRNDIAGVVNKAGNVLGMMPHPERAIDSLHGGTDGKLFFQSILGSL
ncbi:phosphoribosylformylglycinamidine synthase subunit PurQ [Algimonas porphyrae]|uniref:Phosphoribosylformylglycinamidine synthase subunit PurQ n=1 Tax=Algimonas porphyrae TaxID=1128113 RepID=A0ABQ5UXQ5_9PROT|nr:phosphoribosylformylglycinamidine synthase subunit PurQ [Algimonas porphyrae]GLQ20088.1 phosphoribosylformylglycinamidine synthase subunit PurQ [Algimonas porphyrae]